MDLRGRIKSDSRQEQKNSPYARTQQCGCREVGRKYALGGGMYTKRGVQEGRSSTVPLELFSVGWLLLKLVGRPKSGDVW